MDVKKIVIIFAVILMVTGAAISILKWLKIGPFSEEAQKVESIISGVADKFAFGGTWQNRWPKYVDVYEEEWQRFKSA